MKEFITPGVRLGNDFDPMFCRVACESKICLRDFVL